MAPPINEVDVEFEAQIQEIRRLISSTSDLDRRLVLEEQLRELELASIQADQHSSEGAVLLSARPERRKSFRPASAKPRTTLSPLAEDKEVHLTSTSLQPLDVQRSPTLSNLVLDVTASSFDDQFPPTNVLSSGHQSFWMTSGMFPQTLRLTLRESVAIREVDVTFRHVHRLQLRTAPSRTNSQYKLQVLETQVAASESSTLTTHRFRLRSTSTTDREGDRDEDDEDEKEQDQQERQNQNQKAVRVEVIEVGIESAYSDFALVYAVQFHCVDGTASTRTKDSTTDSGDTGDTGDTEDTEDTGDTSGRAMRRPA